MAGLAALAVALASGNARAQTQIPGLPGAASPAPAEKKAAAKAPSPAAPANKEKETVVATAGTIKADTSPRKDKAIEKTLDELLPEFPGVRSIDSAVREGVVRLEGRVDDDDTRDQMTQVVGKVEGVRMVINRLSTDAEVLTAPELVLGKVREIWDVVSRRWLLGLLALGVLVAFSGLAQVFNAYSETLLAPFVRNVLLRSVVGSLLGSLLAIGGLMFALSLLNLTHIVLSILGLAGVVGLAVGFAFKDIAENFIASVLLGVRRPFRIGDYVTVAGQAGVVKSLNTRATVLVTLEGNHVRIPNNVIFKEILVNATASPNLRSSFDVVIPYEASTAAAVEAVNRALPQGDGVLGDPPARALVEALEPGGVRLRVYYWVPVHGADWYKINSDAKLRVKVALQQAGVLAPPPAAPTPVPTAAPAPANGHPPGADAPRTAAAARAEANLRKDTRAAEAARAAPAAGQPTPMQRVLSEAETRVSDEGANLLAEAR